MLRRWKQWVGAGLFASVACGLLMVLTRAPAASVTGPKLVLYWEKGFQGRSLEVTDTVIDLPVIADEHGNEFDWNDQVKSLVVVSGTWVLYQHGRCNTKLDDTPREMVDIRTQFPVEGWSTLISASTLGPLEIPDVSLAGVASDISSIELISELNLPDWAAR